MAMWNEEELAGSSPFSQFKPNEELEKGESFCFYFHSTGTGNSAEYGEFTVLQGVKFECNAKNEKELEQSMSLTGFIPNTLLLNKVAAGQMRHGNAYRIEKAWDRGDKYNGNQKAKGYGYKVFKLNAPDALLTKFDKFVAEQLGTVPQGEEEVDAPKI